MLQFDHAEFTTDAPAAVVCRSCNRPIHDVYYEIGSILLCDGCRQGVEARFRGGSGGLRFLKAATLGLFAAIVGAVILYAFSAITRSSVGIVSILVGYLVGRAVSRGAEHRGGFVYQALAVFLTYSAVAWSFLPFMVAGLAQRAEARQEKNRVEHRKAVDGRRVTPPDTVGSVESKTANDAASGEGGIAAVEKKPAQPSPEPAKQHEEEEECAEERPEGRTLAVAVIVYSVLLFGLSYATPFLGLPQNLIGLLIIFFGLQQAWRLNRKLVMKVNGPFRVGGAVPRSGVYRLMDNATFCGACGTQIAAGLLACPGCHRLVFSDRLKDLAAAAERSERGARPPFLALVAWREALELLPAGTRQHELVEARISARRAGSPNPRP